MQALTATPPAWPFSFRHIQLGIFVCPDHAARAGGLPGLSPRVGCGAQPDVDVVVAVAADMFATGRLVELDQMPRALVDVILSGRPFTGAQLVAAAEGVRWEPVLGLLQQLLFANLLMLSVPDEA